MAIERIAGVSQIPRMAPLRSVAGRMGEAAAGTAAAALPAAADGSLEGELLAPAAQGQQVRLTALAPAGQALRPGQVLLVQVMATSPQLQLALLPGLPGAPVPASPSSSSLSGEVFGPQAMQPDQAEMLRFSRPVLDTAVMAAGWHSMVLRRLQQARAVAEPMVAPPAGQGEAGRNAGLLPLAAARAAGEQALVPMAETAARPVPTLLAFQVWAWPGVALHFWLWRKRPGEATAPRRRSLPGSDLRLRLALALPPLGLVVVDVAVADKAVSLTFMTGSSRVSAALRGRAGLIARRLAGVGLQLARCHAVHEGAGQRSAPQASTTADAAEHLRQSEAALQPPLFRAAAETVAALSLPFQSH